MAQIGVLRTAEGGYLLFHCPGCESAHTVRVASPGVAGGWTFNNDFDRPTFSPSILVTYNGPDAGTDRGNGDKAPPAVCHSFVTDGQIQFLGDCTHSRAGQTVPLTAITEA